MPRPSYGMSACVAKASINPANCNQCAASRRGCAEKKANISASGLYAGGRVPQLQVRLIRAPWNLGNAGSNRPETRTHQETCPSLGHLFLAICQYSSLYLSDKYHCLIWTGWVVPPCKHFYSKIIMYIC